MATKRKPSGFTLVEMVVVILIVGIIAAIALPRLLNTYDTANENAAKRTVTQVRKAIDLYYAENGSYPTRLDDDWFHGPLSNPYDPDHPSPVFVANGTNLYPTHKTLLAGSTFWYNRQNGRFAARVERQDTPAATIALYNRVNNHNITSLSQRN